ncbi:uncharacterized protein LOC115886577 [Sitophilus oryzae]|uniref:Malate dehydrogenase, mitochondrial n=1 Tax=Sitophilus oryzae TaxID=7048 RepID=A0A6J2YE43_SITOR|nr:uncharacterized protein LOC115886577 [Sitophilus oryzae]
MSFLKQIIIQKYVNPIDLLRFRKIFSKNYSSGSSSMKVTVVGAAGKIGQALCLMLKQSPLIDELCVHDLKNTATGLGLELSHIDTKCKVSSFHGKDNLQIALQNSKIVVVLAAAQGVDSLTPDKVWDHNSVIVKDIVQEIARNCPKAMVAIGTNPINSIVPMASELMKKGSSYNPNGVFGITALDTVRANTFVAQMQGLEPECVTVPVIGGNSTETIVPVVSQAKPCAEFTNEEIEDIVASVRHAQENLSASKSTEGTPLSGAFAAARFVISLIKAIQGHQDIIETAYVSSKVHPYLKYCSSPLLLGPNGITRNLGIPKLSDFEQCMLDNAVPLLANDIKKGEHTVGIYEPPPPCNPCGPPKGSPCPHDWCEYKQ